MNADGLKEFRLGNANDDLSALNQPDTNIYQETKRLSVIRK